MLLHSWGHNMFWTKVTISLLEVFLGLLLPVHHVLDLQINPRLTKNGPKWFPMPQNIGFDTKINSTACSEARLHLLLHSLKLSLASYSPSNMFRSIWGSWKWYQIIPYTQKYGIWHQIQVFRFLRAKVTISLLEVVRGFLQPLHPVLDLQIDLRFRKMVQNDSPYQKTWA